MLHILPSHISNLIAAGEVVQRPASVVKELMENAIDAGAKNVSVIISDAGRTLIQVIDDGCGMNEEEAKLCFARHATSKISQAEDLHSILTYGFRGEALASIAAVAQVSLKSRTENQQVGTEVVFAESKFVSQEESTTPQGTNISVRNLFYNVPARRKFLKSEASEFRQIISEFSRVALCHPEVGLKLSHNKKDCFNLRPALHLKQRILEIAGKDVNKELVDLNVKTELIHLNGFVGKPQDAKKSLGNQYFFVNGRFFKSPYLHKAVMKSYENLISEGYTPSYFIFIEIDPQKIDINIHPAKIEVKFEEDSIIFEILSAAVREVLGKNSFAPSIDFDTEGVPDIPIPSKNIFPRLPKIDYDPLFDPFERASNKPSYPISNYGEIFEDKFTKGRSLLQLHGKLIITPVKSGIMVINVSRAKERIFYERILKSLDNNTPVIQESLFELSLELDHNSISTLMEDKDLVKTLGFDINPIDDNHISICGLPDGFPSDPDSVKETIDELLFTLTEIDSKELIKADQRSKIAAILAKQGAKSQSINTSDIEAQLLVDTLFGCNEPNYTPDGRSCMAIITMEELERKL